MKNFTTKSGTVFTKTASALITLGVSLLIITQVSVHAQHLDVTAFPSDVWVKEDGIRLSIGVEDTLPPPDGDATVLSFSSSITPIHTPFVFRFGDTLRMYFDALGTGDMLSAFSLDGLTWTIDAGVRNTGFSSARHPHVLQISDTLFRMYFEGQLGFVGGIGSAISSDGLNWTKETDQNGIIDAFTGQNNNAADPVVFELDTGGFRMYYRTPTQINSATSSDGKNWTIETGTRIANALEFAGIRLPDGTIVLYYAVSGFTAILSKRSSDGLNFSVTPDTVLLPGNHPTDDPEESGKILTTSILQFPGDTIRMYYQGSESTTSVNSDSRVFSAVAVLEEKVVSLDIKPTSCPNPLNVKSNGVLPVAILGTADFDVNNIDVSSVLLEGVAPIRSKIEDVSTPVADKVDVCDCTTDGADTFDDLTLKFKTQDIVSTLGSVSGGDAIVLTITGILLDGTPFDASDCIIITPVGGVENDTAVSKVAICHIPPGNPDNAHTIFVSPDAIDAHLAHGDNLGACDSIAFGGNNDSQRLSAYPNPFSETTIIQFQLDETVNTTLKVFSITGKHIITLFDGIAEENNLYSIQFNTEDLPTGIYYYKLETENGIVNIGKLLSK